MRPADQLKLGGWTPLSTCDWPDMLAAVGFVAGCPWRCGYCHNPHLQTRPTHSDIPFASVVAFMQTRQGLLDGMVFSGGEPCSDPALPAVITQIKSLGFKVGLHTAGCYPERLSTVLPLLDWVGLDIKTVPERYDDLSGRPHSSRAAFEALSQVLAAGIDYEVRTTIHPQWLPTDQLMQLADYLHQSGVRHYALQIARLPARDSSTTVGYPSANLLEACEDMFESFVLR